ncbi:MAG TPA: 2-amino-4-hydroxy-6-hydroxymethyldihydropteridine diphosphokinase [Longimicrobiaceae bacterium]|nr:2-amino-4-hydroxy-6-hydroxymethyldihydropteridine diphosphokinase [Longimicrobiaceae bacterium]
MRDPEQEAFLGLGANLDDPVARLAEAVDRLRRVVRVVSVSAVYRSEPVGYRDQPDFFNLVCRVRTELPPLDLLRATRGIEEAMGRTRTFRDAPRRIDIDLLAYGRVVLDTPELVLPHPRMARRAFVLVPLAEVAPEWRHPVRGETARELLERGEGLERIEWWGVLPAPAPEP